MQCRHLNLTAVTEMPESLYAVTVYIRNCTTVWDIAWCRGVV